MSGILVLVEHLRGEVRDITFEMLTKANQLAETIGTSVSALVLGDAVSNVVVKVGGYCDDLLTVERPALKDFNAELYQPIVADVIRSREPALVMLAHSSLGVDLAPSLAVKTGLPLISDIIQIGHDEKGFLLTRQMYASKINAEWRFKGECGMVTVRSAAFKSGALHRAGTCVPVAASTGAAALRCKFIGYEEAPVTGVDITKASIVVAVGRGIKDPKNLPMVEQFAKSIGAEMGCTRPVIDAGWLPKERQIGNSGKTVKPKLYIGLGISGAFQHTIGMRAAETIVAVNKDPGAPIFSIAHYGIVGDILKVIPALETKIKETKQK